MLSCRRPLISLFGFAVSSVTVLAGPVADVVRLDERGEMAEFIVAKDEVHDGRRARTVPAQVNAEALRSLLQREAGKGDLVLYPKGAERIRENRRLLTRQIAVQVNAGVDVETLARSVEATVERELKI